MLSVTSHCIVLMYRIQFKLTWNCFFKFGKRWVYNLMRCNFVKLIAHLTIIINSEKIHFWNNLLILLQNNSNPYTKSCLCFGFDYVIDIPFVFELWNWLHRAFWIEKFQVDDDCIIKLHSNFYNIILILWGQKVLQQTFLHQQLKKLLCIILVLWM